MARQLPAGMRNNNPGNIKYAGQAGTHPSVNTDQGDPQAVYQTPEAGMAAMYQLLSRKYRGGKVTPNMIIAGKGGWTPGNSQAAANVARYAGIGPNDDINLTDPARAAAFMRGLMLQEHGEASRAYTDAQISAAIGGGPGRPLPKQYALPAAEPPVMDGPRGQEQTQPAGYSTRPQGPVEAAGGGQGADPAMAPPAAPASPYAPPDGPKGQESYAAPADAAPAPAKPSFWASLAKNIGKMGTDGGLPGTIAPASGGGPIQQAARIDQPEVPFIDPQGGEQQRQMLAMAMQRLNSGRLF